MKANEFVKKFGIHIADHCLNDCASPDDRWFVHYGALIDGEDFDDLKRLVESHELVASWGGLADAKKELQRQSILRWINPETERLRVAIADVESCMEVNQ